MEQGISSLFSASNGYIEQYGYLAIFVLLFCETTLFLGFLIPGVIMLVLAGYICAAGTLSSFVVIFLAILATILGDNTSYFFGRFLGKKYIHFPDSIQESAQKNWWILLFFHHLPLTRMFIPAFFGTNKILRYRSWLSLDIFSAVVFVITYFSLGFFTQKITGNIEKIYLKVNNIIIIAILLIAIVWVIKLIKDKKIRDTQQLKDKSESQKNILHENENLLEKEESQIENSSHKNENSPKIVE